MAKLWWNVTQEGNDSLLRRFCGKASRPPTSSAFFFFLSWRTNARSVRCRRCFETIHFLISRRNQTDRLTPSLAHKINEKSFFTRSDPLHSRLFEPLPVSTDRLRLWFFHCLYVDICIPCHRHTASLPQQPGWMGQWRSDHRRVHPTNPI